VVASGATKFEMAGKEASQEEVINHLKSKGIDLENNRFLILQGEVESISQMVPKSGSEEKPGLLEYLEVTKQFRKLSDLIK
jgi:structural maintenance of chromosome 4